MAAAYDAPGPSTDTQAKYSCTFCDKSFSNNSNMVRHVKQLHGELIPGRPCFSCDQCKASFSYHKNLLQHRSSAHGFMAVTVNLKFATENGECLCCSHS